jgi:hypothetical protein
MLHVVGLEYCSRNKRADIKWKMEKLPLFTPALILPLLHILMPMSYLKRGDEIQCAFHAHDG